MLTCPICEAPLEQTHDGLRCAHRHAFDRAREGYVHLVASRQAGDTRPMLRARRAFLERGHYQPLAELLSTLAIAHLDRSAAAGEHASELAGSGVLDAGCGEGYYLGRLHDALAAALATAPSCLGLDVSKEAVRFAARRYPDVSFVVADIRTRLPIASESIGVLLSNFAPRNPAEFARIAAPTGLLLVVIPAPSHLSELRAVVPLLGIEPDKEPRMIDQLVPAFTPCAAHTLEYPMPLAPDDMTDLLAMTPSARHLRPGDLDAARAYAPPTVTAAFRVLVFQRVGRRHVA